LIGRFDDPLVPAREPVKKFARAPRPGGLVHRDVLRVVRQPHERPGDDERAFRQRLGLVEDAALVGENEEERWSHQAGARIGDRRFTEIYRQGG
jgi:hypothetical protein